MNAPETLAPRPTTLRGSFIYSLDRKGRLVVPIEFREKLAPTIGAPLILFPAIQPAHPEGFWSLVLTDLPTWEAIEARADGNPEWWALHGSTACEVVPDPSTGRILLPAALRELCAMRSHEEILVRGMGPMVQAVRYVDWQREMRGCLGEGHIKEKPYYRARAVWGCGMRTRKLEGSVV